jgi:hypothetical protein
MDAHATGSSTPRERVNTTKLVQEPGVVSGMELTID